MEHTKFYDNWVEQSSICGQSLELVIHLTSTDQKKNNQPLTSVLLIGLLERSFFMASAVLLVAGSATNNKS